MIIDIGQDIKELREEAGLSVMGLAKKANMTRQNLYRLERLQDARIMRVQQVLHTLGYDLKIVKLTRRDEDGRR